MLSHVLCFFFFFNDTATTEIYTLSLHDALPISKTRGRDSAPRSIEMAVVLLGDARLPRTTGPPTDLEEGIGADRKSTRLNSSHLVISYAVFCLKKKKKKHMSLSPRKCEN